MNWIDFHFIRFDSNNYFMKYLIFLPVLFCLNLIGQKPIPVNNLIRSTVQPGKHGIIIGNFVQRLGFASGGFSQQLEVINLNTKRIYSLNVKPTFKSKRENIMCFQLPIGVYAIFRYTWTQSKWYGGRINYEPIYKGFDSGTDEFKVGLEKGKVTMDMLEWYTFEVKNNQLYYVGTWDFSDGVVKFYEEKEKFLPRFTKRYKKMKLASIENEIPK